MLHVVTGRGHGKRPLEVNTVSTGCSSRFDLSCPSNIVHVQPGVTALRPTQRGQLCTCTVHRMGAMESLGMIAFGFYFMVHLLHGASSISQIELRVEVISWRKEKVGRVKALVVETLKTKLV